MEPSTQRLSEVTCPFCGLACDDLTVTNATTGLDVVKNGCAISTSAFRQLGRVDASQSSPRIKGKPASADAAIVAAARILASAKAPLIGGFGTDVGGARAVLALADRIGAVVDHMNMPAKLRNILTLQNSGWITTTLAEIKNRADFVLIIGSSALTRFPRFYERVVSPSDTMFAGNPAIREVVFLGDTTALAGNLPSAAQQLHCSHASLARLLPALRALVNGQSVDNRNLAVSDVKILTELADRMKQAHYGVIAWAAPDFDFPHSELTIQTLADLIKDLNKTIRVAGFPLGGSDGDFSANGTQTWQTGLPLRSRYGKQGLDFDPYRNSAEKLIAENEVDALLWISSFNAARTPPEAEIPQIVLGPPFMALQREPEVFIPVGTPGIHHGGHMIRTDKVVVMRLKKVIENSLPSVADIASRLLQELASY